MYVHVYRIPLYGWPFGISAKNDASGRPEHRNCDFGAGDCTDWTGQHWCSIPSVTKKCRLEWTKSFEEPTREKRMPQECPVMKWGRGWACPEILQQMNTGGFVVKEPVRHARACKQPREWSEWQKNETMLIMRANVDGLLLFRSNLSSNILSYRLRLWLGVQVTAS